MVDDAFEEYALGILDSGRQAAVERHLIRCTRCAAMISSFQQTVAVLALAAPLAQPPASARTALLARIGTPAGASIPAPTLYGGSLDALRTPTIPASPPVSAASPATPQSQPSWWRVYAAPLATLPLLLALGLVAAWGLNNYSELNAKEDQLAARDMQIARLSSQLSNDNNEGVAEVVTSTSSKRYQLEPERTGSTTAEGLLIADPQTDKAILLVSGLTSGYYAVVTQLQNGAIVSNGEFLVDDSGSAITPFNLGAQVSDVQSVHIRPTTSLTETDVVALDGSPDVLMTTLGPGAFDNSDTSPQSP